MTPPVAGFRSANLCGILPLASNSLSVPFMPEGLVCVVNWFHTDICLWGSLAWRVCTHIACAAASMTVLWWNWTVNFAPCEGLFSCVANFVFTLYFLRGYYFLKVKIKKVFLTLENMIFILKQSRAFFFFIETNWLFALMYLSMNLRMVHSIMYSTYLLGVLNNETAAILVSQTNPVGVELFSCIFAWLMPHERKRSTRQIGSQWKEALSLAF